MSRAANRAKLAELRALRQSGKKAFDSYQVEDVGDIYDEVDEDGYKKIVRNRLNQDDFVVDDNGEGYADDGREDWDRVQQYDSDSDTELPRAGRPTKAGELTSPQSQSVSLTEAAAKIRQTEQAKRDASDRNISEYFTKGAGKSAPKPKV